jgi:hypothetical protein
MPSARLRSPRGPLASTTKLARMRTAVTCAAQRRAAVEMPLDSIERDLVQILDTERDRFADQKVIDVGAQPVSIGQFVVRACGDEQLVGSISGSSIALARLVLEIREPAFQAADDIWIRALPGAEGGERTHTRQVVAIGELLDDHAGQRRRRFTNREARMSPALDERDSIPEPPRDHREYRPAKSRADNGEISVGSHSHTLSDR